MIKECARCREAFVASHASQKYCTVKCRRLAGRAPRKIVTKDCVVCGQTFVATRRSSQKYCDEECRQLATLKQSNILRNKRDLATKERYAAVGKIWRLANKERMAANNKAWSAANKDKLADYNRAWGIQNKYGMTLEDWNLMFVNQNERCAICFATEPSDKAWHTDHNHETGKVRGILCRSCNLMLGNAKDNFNILRRGADYLFSTEL